MLPDSECMTPFLKDLLFAEKRFSLLSEDKYNYSVIPVLFLRILVCFVLFSWGWFPYQFPDFRLLTSR